MAQTLTFKTIRLVKTIVSTFEELDEWLDDLNEAGMLLVYFDIVELDGRIMFVGTAEADTHIPMG